MDRHNWLCCKWVNNNVLPSIFNIPHLPKSKIFVCSHVLKEDFSNLNTHLTKASEQYCPHPPVWGPGSTVRGEQWMCYSTVGWVPPACAPPYHDYTHMLHIKQALLRTLAFVKFSALSGSLCSDHMRPWLALLLSPHRWLRRDDSAPSPSRIQSYLCALSFPLGLLIWKILPLPYPRSALVSPAHFTGEGSLRASAVHDPTVPRTHRRTLASYGDTLTTPSPAGYYVNIPSLPPSPLPSLSSNSCRPAWFIPNPQNIVGLEAVLHPWNGRWANLKYSGHNIITMAAKRAERTFSLCILTN